MALSKSQRVKTISKIAERLAVEDWTTIDLTLQQFGFPTTDAWSGDKKDYGVHMIGDGSDADLIELAEHFGIDVPGSPSPAPAAADPPYWEEGKLKVFVSHLSSAKADAAALKTALAHDGMSCFVAHDAIDPTLEWQLEIETALSTCELLIALLHPEFITSKWCDQEIGYALGRGVPVFTVRRGADPHGFVSRFQAFNGNSKTADQIASELITAAMTHKKLQARMAAILVDQFVNSGSFATAKRRIALLEQLTYWRPEFSERIVSAIDTNSQISGSWGVPSRVEALAQKHASGS